MSAISNVSARRNFIRTCATSLALFSTGCMPQTGRITRVSAASSSLLPSRKGAERLLLNYNENSFGMSGQALDAAQLATEKFGNRYPDAAVKNLREELADLHGVKTTQVIFGNGSTEVIQAVVTMVEGLGVEGLGVQGSAAKVIEPSPTFGDARRYGNAEGLEVIQVPVGNGFETDISALREKADANKGPLLINICNPNNPTGTIVDQKALTNWINQAPDHHIFLIDEAYFDYAQINPEYSSVLPLIKSGKENLILTRTFSKIYGMAGMRIGYGIAAPKTAKEVRKFAAGYNLSAAGTAAALASLSDSAFYQSSMKSNLKAKSHLLSTLDKLDLEHVQSNTNFVLHRINNTLDDYSARMSANGILVGRRMTKDDGWNRISLGTPSEMEAFSKVLIEFRERGWV